MLFFGKNFNNISLVSIRSSGKIGTINKPIINPYNLHIDGFLVSSLNRSDQGVVVDIDIRELSPMAIIINDHEDISEPDDLVRLKPVIAINFDLIGKSVYSGKTKLGKVEDYVVDTKSLFIQKIHVQPSLLRISSGQMIFDRQSIVEVTNTKIVVSGPEQKVRSFIRQKLPSSPSAISPSTSSISE